jgi:hypothetical protein
MADKRWRETNKRQQDLGAANSSPMFYVPTAQNRDCLISTYLRNALVLDLRGVLEPAVSDGAEYLGLEQEIPEAGAVDGYVVALHAGLLVGGGGGSVGSVGHSRLNLLLLLVVEQITLVNVGVGHFEKMCDKSSAMTNSKNNFNTYMKRIKYNQTLTKLTTLQI